VLEAFTLTFDFTGMRIDTAIRTYLETFRLPGEAQKINRIMESFGKHYHAQVRKRARAAAPPGHQRST
jgi:brefeldin A-resistance guanine nucleotide exchange factor 1